MYKKNNIDCYISAYDEYLKEPLNVMETPFVINITNGVDISKSIRTMLDVMIDKKFIVSYADVVLICDTSYHYANLKDISDYVTIKHSTEVYDLVTKEVKDLYSPHLIRILVGDDFSSIMIDDMEFKRKSNILITDLKIIHRWDQKLYEPHMSLNKVETLLSTRDLIHLSRRLNKKNEDVLSVGMKNRAYTVSDVFPEGKNICDYDCIVTDISKLKMYRKLYRDLLGKPLDVRVGDKLLVPDCRYKVTTNEGDMYVDRYWDIIVDKVYDMYDYDDDMIHTSLRFVDAKLISPSNEIYTVERLTLDLRNILDDESLIDMECVQYACTTSSSPLVVDFLQILTPEDIKGRYFTKVFVDILYPFQNSSKLIYTILRSVKKRIRFFGEPKI